MTESLRRIAAELRKLKGLGDAALARMPGPAFRTALDPDSNSAAVIVKHMAGNMRSRFSDFLLTDGEKPGRNRDAEFVLDVHDSRASLMQHWDRGWRRVFDTVDALTEADLEKTVFVRGEPHSVFSALLRQLSHYAYHTGQLVLLAKHHTRESWESLSIPRGKSREFVDSVRRHDQTDLSAGATGAERNP